MICNTCKSIFVTDDVQTGSTPDADEGLVPHHVTCQSLKDSINLGCYICSWLWTTLTPNERDLITASTTLGTLHLGDDRTSASVDHSLTDSEDGSSTDSEEKSITMSILIDGNLSGRSGCYLLQLFINSGTVDPAANPNSAYMRGTFVLHPHDNRTTASEHTYVQNGLPRSTNSAETLSFARNWLESCVTGHHQCRGGIGEGRWYPTRLLDCGTLGAPQTCLLVETSATGIEGPYMTLSHCWGRAECLKLTTDNHTQLLHQIPPSALPRLYQDAITVTRRLGIRYLWIDSLCIIQRGDDSADWKREVGLMDKVYLNSFCNISPTDAPDAHHSIFCMRNPDILYPQIVNVSAGGKASPYSVVHTDPWETEVAGSRLNRRAWVLQERLLSPRVLHFGRTRMFWECRTTDASEVYPNGLPPKLFGSSYTRFKDLTPGHHVVNGKTDSRVAAYQTWAQIVEKYTACELTFPSDKLVALSAIAKMMANILQDEYVAGMWRRDIERELLWFVSRRRGGNISRPTTYRAPSWSWAAVDGAIAFGRRGPLGVEDDDDMLIEVEDVQLDYSTHDKTILVQGGWLRLRGMLKKTALLHRHDSPANYGETWVMDVNGAHTRLLFDYAIPNAGSDGVNDGNANLYCIPARLLRAADGSINMSILVLRADDQERGIFRRVGFAFSFDQGEDAEKKILARMPEESQFPCEEYRDGLHSIRVL